MARSSVGARDNAGPRVTRDPAEARNRRRYEQRESRKGARRERGEAPRIEEAGTIDEALDAEYERGRRSVKTTNEEQRAAERRRGYSAGKQDASRPASSSSSNTPASSSSSSGTGSKVAGALVPKTSGIPSVSAPLLVEVVLISADELVNKHRFPLPSRLLVAFGLFGALGLVRGRAEGAATAIAWGLVVSSFYAAVPGAKKPPGLSALGGIGDFVSGKYAKGAKGGTSAGGAAGAVGGAVGALVPPSSGGAGGRLNR